MDRPEPVNAAVEDDPRVAEVEWDGDQFGQPVVRVKVDRGDDCGEVAFMPEQLQSLPDPHGFIIAHLDAMFGLVGDPVPPDPARSADDNSPPRPAETQPMRQAVGYPAKVR